MNKRTAKMLKRYTKFLILKRLIPFRMKNSYRALKAAWGQMTPAERTASRQQIIKHV